MTFSISNHTQRVMQTKSRKNAKLQYSSKFCMIAQQYLNALWCQEVSEVR